MVRGPAVLKPLQRGMLGRGTIKGSAAMSNKSNATIATMGIDIGKNSLHIVGLDRRGAIVLRQKWSRGQVEARLANRVRLKPLQMKTASEQSQRDARRKRNVHVPNCAGTT
jgi:hypothetical protein